MQPDDRLMCAISFARRGKRFADIGTDHAFIPIYLVENRISSGGVASDINEGPVLRAGKNIREAGLSGSISVLKTDGLNGIEAFSPDDIFILGMGGELISSIITAAEFVRNEKYRLILQPMTHAEEVRRTLCNLGFGIIGEKIIRDGRRFYQIIAAEFDGIKREFSELDLIIGRTDNPTETHLEYVRYLMGVNRKIASGKQKSGIDCSCVERINAELESFAAKFGK